jgi:hypothetical protein
MPLTPSLRAHDDYHLEPIFHRYDVDAIIAKLLAGRSTTCHFGTCLTEVFNVSNILVRGGPTDVSVMLTFEEIKYLCLAAR